MFSVLNKNIYKYANNNLIRRAYSENITTNFYRFNDGYDALEIFTNNYDGTLVFDFKDMRAGETIEVSFEMLLVDGIAQAHIYQMHDNGTSTRINSFNVEQSDKFENILALFNIPVDGNYRVMIGARTWESAQFYIKNIYIKSSKKFIEPSFNIESVQVVKTGLFSKTANGLERNAYYGKDDFTITPSSPTSNYFILTYNKPFTDTQKRPVVILDISYANNDNRYTILSSTSDNEKFWFRVFDRVANAFLTLNEIPNGLAFSFVSYGYNY